MKNLFYLLTILWTLLCWSCSTGGEENVEPAPPFPNKNIVEIFGSAPVVAQEGGTATVDFTATSSWTAKVSDESRTSSWCSVSPTSGGAGTYTLNISTTPNDTYDERHATVTLTCGTTSKSFTVSQKQKDALTASSAKNEFTALGGELVIEVKANISFEAVVDDACKSWITSASSRGLTTSTLKYTVAENETMDKREGLITIVSGDFKEEIKVFQEGFKPVIVLTQDEYTVGSEGATVQVELKSNVDYSVQLPDVDWVKEEASRAFSSHTHYFAVEPNEEYDLRTAGIIFSNTELALSDTVRIVQVQKNALIVAKNEYTVEGNGGTLEFTVNANVEFEVSANVDWIRQNTESRGLTEYPLSFTVDENILYESREGIISVVSGVLKQEIRVKQEAQSKPFAILKKEYVLPKSGSRFVVDIHYNEPYKILKISSGLSDSDFIIQEPGHDKLVFFALDGSGDMHKEIVVSNMDESIKETIHIVQKDTDEQLHAGSGNSYGAYGYIIHNSGGLISYDVHTNLEKYDIFIFGNTASHKAKHVRSEKTDFGFREYFEVPMNDTDKDIDFDFAYVGPNITFMTGVTVKRQLFVYFDEPDEMYISGEGETFTTHAWTEDDNLNIRLEGGDVSWLSVQKTEDTYIDGIRRINTTFVASPNQSGKTREISIVAFNGFDDKDIIRVIQPSGESVLLSSANLYIGAWKNSYDLVLKKCEYTVKSDASWLVLGNAKEQNGTVVIPMRVEAYTGEGEREAVVTIQSGSITNKVFVKQLPESGALVDDSSERWKAFKLPRVDVKKPYPNQRGSMLYFAIVENPVEFIHIQSRRVLDLLYYGPEDEYIPKLSYLEYVLDNYDGISACYGGGGMKGIVLSNQYVESYYNANGAKALVEENKGVLSHELTHAFQLEPKGCGDYNSSKVFHSCIEGMADAVRVLSGGFPNKEDRPRGGHYLDSYRYTGFFIAWCVKNKDKDFLRKFNLSTQYVVPWSFDGAIKYVLGEQYNVDDLWTEYLKAMGDI